MPTRASKIAVLIIPAIALLILVVISILRPWYDASERSKPDIRIAYLPIYVDLPLFVAARQGFFEKRGIAVELVPFQTSPDMASALIGKQVDAVASIATSTALSVETRDPGRFKIFLVDAETPEAPLSALMVPSTSSISAPSELAGKIIASFPGPTAQVFGPLALEKLGLEKGTYTIQELPITSHIVALETGRVDAILTYEPTATVAELKYRSKRIVAGPIESNVINPWQAGVWVVGVDSARNNPDLTIKFVSAIEEAVLYIRENPSGAKHALGDFTPIEPDVAERIPSIPFTTIKEADLVTLQRHADLLASHGSISRKLDVTTLMFESASVERK